VKPTKAPDDFDAPDDDLPKIQDASDEKKELAHV
jgi:hypothetical protein